ncbi:MAG: response regulator [Persicimonas sp.]
MGQTPDDTVGLQAAQTVVEMSDSKKSPGGETERLHEGILIVDDEPLIRQLCARILKRSGYASDTAATAEQAIEVVESSRVDLVICDMLLPNCRGDRLVERLKEIEPALRAICVSGHDLESEALSQVDLPPDTIFLQKPFGAFELLDHVAHFFGPEDVPIDAVDESGGDL